MFVEIFWISGTCKITELEKCEGDASASELNKFFITICTINNSVIQSSKPENSGDPWLIS